MPDAAALLGTWRMTSWKRELLATGERLDALGPDTVGFNCGADGRFYALVVRNLYSQTRTVRRKLAPRRSRTTWRST